MTERKKQIKYKIMKEKMKGKQNEKQGIMERGRNRIK